MEILVKECNFRSLLTRSWFIKELEYCIMKILVVLEFHVKSAMNGTVRDRCSSIAYLTYLTYVYCLLKNYESFSVKHIFQRSLLNCYWCYRELEYYFLKIYDRILFRETDLFLYLYYGHWINKRPAGKFAYESHIKYRGGSHTAQGIIFNTV